MTKTPKRQLGDLGEGIVCRFLERKGFRVIGRNYLKKWGEIDIIAKKGSKISFFEVKTTVSREPGVENGSRGTWRPEEKVHVEKVKRLQRAIHSYLAEHRLPETQEWALDIACVYLDIPAKRAKVEIIENVF